jgi:hypothetical protein
LVAHASAFITIVFSNRILRSKNYFFLADLEEATENFDDSGCCIVKISLTIENSTIYATIKQIVVVGLCDNQSFLDRQN